MEDMDENINRPEQRNRCFALLSSILDDLNRGHVSGFIYLHQCQPVVRILESTEASSERVLGHDQYREQFLTAVDDVRRESWQAAIDDRETMTVRGWLKRWWLPACPETELLDLSHQDLDVTKEFVGIRVADFPVTSGAASVLLGAGTGEDLSAGSSRYVVARTWFALTVWDLAIEVTLGFRPGDRLKESQSSAQPQTLQGSINASPRRRPAKARRRPAPSHEAFVIEAPELDHPALNSQGVGWWHGG